MYKLSSYPTILIESLKKPRSHCSPLLLTLTHSTMTTERCDFLPITLYSSSIKSLTPSIPPLFSPQQQLPNKTTKPSKQTDYTPPTKQVNYSTNLRPNKQATMFGRGGGAPFTGQGLPNGMQAYGQGPQCYDSVSMSQRRMEMPTRGDYMPYDVRESPFRQQRERRREREARRGW